VFGIISTANVSAASKQRVEIIDKQLLVATSFDDDNSPNKIDLNFFLETALHV
jgi:hypothetical protein